MTLLLAVLVIMALPLAFWGHSLQRARSSAELPTVGMRRTVGPPPDGFD